MRFASLFLAFRGPLPQAQPCFPPCSDRPQPPTRSLVRTEGQLPKPFPEPEPAISLTEPKRSPDQRRGGNQTISYNRNGNTIDRSETITMPNGKTFTENSSVTRNGNNATQPQSSTGPEGAMQNSTFPRNGNDVTRTKNTTGPKGGEPIRAPIVATAIRSTGPIHSPGQTANRPRILPPETVTM